MAVTPVVTPTGTVDSAGRSVVAGAPSDPFSNVPAVNTAAVRTFAAVAGQRHRLTALAFSYSAAPTGGRITVADGASTVLDLDVTVAGQVADVLPAGGIQGSENTNMVITLAAAGAAVQGKLFTAKITA